MGRSLAVGLLVSLLVFTTTGIEDMSLDALFFVLGATTFVACLFALERRGVSFKGTALRLVGGGLLGLVCVPLVLIGAQHLGDSLGAFESLAREVGRLDLLQVFAMALGAAVVTLAFGLLPFHVRAQTERLLPQVVVGGLTVAPFVALVLASGERDSLLVALGTLAFGLGAFAALQGADRLLRRRDPACPRPPGNVDLRRAIGLAFPLAAGQVAVLFLGVATFSHHRYGAETAAIGALKTLSCSQSLYREGGRNDQGDYAGNLGPLAEEQLVDTILGSGVKQGYLFRLTRSPATPEFLWAAAADPIAPGRTGDRSFFTNQGGVIFYTTEGPVAYDPVRCEPPAGMAVVGK